LVIHVAKDSEDKRGGLPNYEFDVVVQVISFVVDTHKWSQRIV